MDKEIFIENKLEYNKYLLDTDTEFKDIKHFLALGWLTDNELIVKNLLAEILGTLSLYPGLFFMSIAAFKQDFFMQMQLTRSKKGFEARLQRSNISESDNRIVEQKAKQPLLR